ncbi:hypothetical protein SAMN00790413_02810 [Deinococcus hopiensis KR-140]|uniref:Uncharacterized protein n=1 Tax=Deinococcus hopiensis KR-140 TaxID=695939 RepID=A0A1W1VPV6_9DEIO|nr:hypothetical protein SAMN00790413_02810 [Deinococcus hopiensis KR-140]
MRSGLPGLAQGPTADQAQAAAPDPGVEASAGFAEAAQEGGISVSPRPSRVAERSRCASNAP